MDDIVERLREEAKNWEPCEWGPIPVITGQLEREAADEIERLRAELAAKGLEGITHFDEMRELTAERDRLRELLRELSQYADPSLMPTFLRITIDAALKEGE